MPVTSSEPTMPVVRPVGDAEPVGSETARPERRSVGHPNPWWLGPALVGVVVVAVIGLLLAATDPFGAADPLRRGSGASGSNATADPLVASMADPDVASAYGGLVGAIEDARASGELSGDQADALREHATAIGEAYLAGDRSALDAAVGDLTERLARGVASGDVTTAAAASIDDALDQLVLAMSGSLPSGLGATSAGGAPGNSGDSNAHGPPAHANGNGNGGDEGD